MNPFRRILIPALLFAFAISPVPHAANAQTKAAAAAQGEPLDINTASRDQLKALPGIGDAYADRILKGRPYAAKNQLTQKGILPDNTYAKIQNMIIAKRSK